MKLYRFHLGDYAAHTKHLSLLEDLAYRRMLDLYYTQEAPLPSDPKKIARLIGMTDHLELVELVLSEFFQDTDKGWKNVRCEEEIAGLREMQTAGRRGATKRWGGHRDANGVAMGTPMGTLSIPHTPPHEDPNATNTNTNTNTIKRESVCAPALGAFPSPEQAELFCQGSGLPTAHVKEWHSNRSSQGWVKGNGIPITNWHADLKSWIYRQAREDIAKGRKASKPAAMSKYAEAF
jgi:uncharacterized protein YdaU (DUF1376 family)